MSGPILYLELAFPEGGAQIRAKIRDSIQADSARVSFETRAEAESLALAFEALAGHREILACSQAMVLISDRAVAFRQTSLPFARPKKIAQVLPLELAPSLPWLDQPFLTDFSVHKISFAQGRHLIVSGSVPESLVRKIVSGLNALGLSPRIIAPAGFTAALSFLAQSEKTEDTLFLRFARDSSTLVVAAEGTPVMVRSLAPGLSPRDLSVEIHRTCTGWRQLSGRTGDLCLVLSVEPGTDPLTLAAYEEFQTQTVKGSLKALPSFKEIIRHNGPAGNLAEPWPTALINFCKGEYGPGGTIRKQMAELITAGIIGGLAAALFFIGLYMDVSRLEGQVRNLRSQATALYQETFPQKPLNPAHPPLLLMQSHIKAAEQQQDQTDGATLEAPPAARAVDLLYTLSHSIPKTIDADLTRLLFSRNQATLTGSTDNFNAVDQVKTALEKSTLFSSVTIITAEAEKTGGRVMFKFRVEME